MRASIFLIGLALSVANPAWASVGRIKTVAGEASIIRGPASIPAIPGSPIEEGDVLVTGKAGRLGVVFIDDTRFALGPSSKITVNELNFDRKGIQGTFVASVNRGTLGIVPGKIAKSNKEAMKVRTPTSLLGVRGTKFVVDVK